jgi:hypothetical protein
VSRDAAAGLRVALVHAQYGAPEAAAETPVVTELARGLAARGHQPTVIASHRGARRSSNEDGVRVLRIRRLPEAPLRARGFADGVVQIPSTVAALRGGNFDIGHSFSAVDAQAVLLWRRTAGAPAVFTCVEPPRRGNLADRRLRLWLVKQAFEFSDSVTATSGEAEAAIKRWLAAEVPTVVAGDVRAYESIYRKCLAARAQT